jgi:GT2 family glycosyltransferase
VVDAGANLGFAEGVNRGIEVASGAWIATLNNDAAAHPDWIAEQRRAVREGGPRLGMIQSRIVFRHAPDRVNSSGVLISPNGEFHDRDFDLPVDGSAGGGDVFCVSAGAALYRREMLDALRLPTGVFDRSFFMYYEDVDLGWRARLAGWDAVYVPTAIVEHAFHGSASRRGDNFVFGHCRRNRVRTIIKNGSLRLMLRGLPKLVSHIYSDVRAEGPSALPAYVRAVIDAVPQRRVVARLAVEDRRAVELRWATR